MNHFKTCLDIIMDRADVEEFNPSLNLQRSVQDLYGLIHARFILTKRGQDKMYRKFKEAVFGVCPLLTCEAQPVLPVGLKDELGEQNVLVYCPRCRQVMVPAVMAASRYEEIELDGAYFGTTFPHLFFLQNPHLLPPPPLQMARYVPRVFGFKVRFPTEEERLAEVASAALSLGDDDRVGGGEQYEAMEGLAAAGAAASGLGAHFVGQRTVSGRRMTIPAPPGLAGPRSGPPPPGLGAQLR